MLAVKGLGSTNPCPPGYVNISKTTSPNCVRRCDPSRYSGNHREWWNPATQTCQLKCDDTRTGTTWNAQLQRCSPLCSYPYHWDANLTRCVPGTPPKTQTGTAFSCPANQTWNAATQKCGCPAGQEADFHSKQCKPCSMYGMAWNPSIGKCQVPGSVCGGGKIWNASTNTCACPAGTEADFNTQQCQPCDHYGLAWNKQRRRCQQPGKFCGSKKVWDFELEKCVPASGLSGSSSNASSILWPTVAIGAALFAVGYLVKKGL